MGPDDRGAALESDGHSNLPPSNWGVFGSEDQLGTLNYLTPERVLAGASCVRTGQRYPLNLPIDTPSAPNDQPAFKRDGPQYEHGLFRNNMRTHSGMIVNDDYVKFATQASSQWDSLAHVGFEADGERGVFYNGVGMADVDHEVGARRNGIEAFAKVGIVGRGVLIDIARYVAGGSEDPLPLDHVITTDETIACMYKQEVEVRPGDIVCFRTGWIELYLDSTDSERQKLICLPDGSLPRVPGIDPLHAHLAHAQQWAAVAADNTGVEALPPPVPSAHILMLRNLGLPFGELLNFTDLAAACAADRRYEFLFVAIPMWIPGGIGSPANAIAIR